MSEVLLTSRDSAKQYYSACFAFNELYAQWAKSKDLNCTTMFCLYAIRRSEEEPTPGHVANVLRLSKQTVNSALDILENKGYITRRIDPMNRRSRRITLTAEGFAVADKLVDSLYALEQQIFGKLNQRERKMLIRLTEKVTDRMEEVIK